MTRPVLTIIVSGGVVSRVLSDEPLVFRVIDFDNPEGVVVDYADTSESMDDHVTSGDAIVRQESTEWRP